MKRSVVSKIILACCVCACCAVLMTSCAGQAESTGLTEEQKANTEYMSSINSAINQLDDVLANFSAAVTAGDTSSMKKAVNEANTIVGNIESFKAPDALVELQSGYSTSVRKLQSVLEDYVAIYSQKSSLSASEIASRVSVLQASYNEAYELLKKTDETASSMG